MQSDNKWWAKWWGSESAVSLLGAIIIMVLGYVIGVVENYISLSGVLIAAGLVVFNVILVFLFLRLFGFYELGRISQTCKVVSETNKNTLLEGISIRIEGVITPPQLKAIESSVSEEAWIMCPSLLLDRGYLFEVVTNNLKRGVIYKYVLPDTKKVRSRFQQLIKHWEKEGIDVSLQVKALFIKDAEIFTDVGIYDPLTKKAKAIIWMPPLPEFEKYGSKYQKGFLVDDPEPIDYLVSFYQGLWEVRGNEKA